MTNGNQDAEERATQPIFTRDFDAPRDLVWQAWTEAERLAQWWGPQGFTMPECNLDLRPGGIFHYCMRSPGGSELWGKFVYREIVEPERLVFVSSFSDAEARVVRNPFSPDWPLEVLNTVEFSEHGGGTRLTAWAVPVNASESERETFDAARDSVRIGFAGTLDQLAAHLATV